VHAASVSVRPSAYLCIFQPKSPDFGFRRNIGSVSAIDSAIFRSLFGTDEIRKVWVHPTLIHAIEPPKKVADGFTQVFDDTAYINRCVDAETALARAQSRCGIVPRHIGSRSLRCAMAEDWISKDYEKRRR
jgi:hypothetical protein